MKHASNPRRLLCRLPTWVGDSVMVTPALRALRRAFPGAEIIIQGRRHLLDLLRGGDLFDRAIETANGKGRIAANIRAQRECSCDLAVIFPHSFRSAWESYRAGIPRRVGYAREWRRFLLTDYLTPHRVGGRVIPVPMVYQYLELVSLLGAIDDGKGLSLPVSARTREQGEETLARFAIGDDRLVVVNPGASFGPSKIWPLEYLAKVCDKLQREDGTRVLILCGPGEEELARSLESQMESQPLNTADQILGLDLSKVIIERADLMISTDTGPRHMAVAMGTPTLVLMGSTDPRYTNSHLGNSIVLRREVPCGPCHKKICPIDHRCMTGILPETALEAARRLLDPVPVAGDS